MVLLFGTSFAAYATAYALTSGHIGLVPLKIGELISGNVLSDPHQAYALAFGMVIVIAVAMSSTSPSTGGPRAGGGACSEDGALRLVLARARAPYFFIPLAATAEFSLKDGDSYRFAAYREIFDDPEFRSHVLPLAEARARDDRRRASALHPDGLLGAPALAAATPLVQFLSALPFVVPPIVLIVGILYVYNYQWVPSKYLGSPYYLVPGYVVLSFPFMFFALDNAFRAIDVHTLTEASQSLGAAGRARSGA